MNNIKSINEWIPFDDEANRKAVNSWLKKTTKSYVIKVDEPFTFKTENSEEFYKMRYLLMLAGAKYTDSILEPSVVPGMMVKEGANPLRSLSFDSDKIKRHMAFWKNNNLNYKVWKEEGGVTYVEFATDDDFQNAKELSQELIKRTKINENILPRPYKKVKCLECGEITNSDLNSKFAHLYNKHNCKPSVDDFKAKEMLKKYFK